MSPLYNRNWPFDYLVAENRRLQNHDAVIESHAIKIMIHFYMKTNCWISYWTYTHDSFVILPSITVVHSHFVNSHLTES